MLSDASQAVGLENLFPDELQDEKLFPTVFLTEVVRSSKRIVAGAAAFQLGVGGGNSADNGGQGAAVTCHHESDGPPLRSHIFDIKTEDGGGGPNAVMDERLYYGTYAHHTLEAIRGLVASFPTLSMHNRGAILVPSDEFLHVYRRELQSRLDASFPALDGRVNLGGRFKLVSANEAAACLDVGDGTGARSGKAPASSNFRTARLHK